MSEQIIVFEENSFPIELTGQREIARAIASGRLRAETLITVSGPGVDSHSCLAGDLDSLRASFGLPPKDAPIPSPDAVADGVPETPFGSANSDQRLAGQSEHREPPGSDDGDFASPWASAASGSSLRPNLTGPSQDLAVFPPGFVAGNARPGLQPEGFLACAFFPLTRYADFSGRSSRREYFGFALLQLAFLFFCLIMIGGGSEGGGMALLILGCLALFIPGLATGVRRLHDQGKSGWFLLLSLIPYVGGLIVFVLMCLPGTSGTNSFGPDPRG